MKLRRGSIWWVEQPGQTTQATDRTKRRRPYLVVSGDAWNATPEYPRVTLCPLTRAHNVQRRYDTDVYLPKRETGLPKDSVVRCVEIYTVFRSELVDCAGALTPKRMLEVDQALSLYLTLPGAAETRTR